MTSSADDHFFRDPCIGGVDIDTWRAVPAPGNPGGSRTGTWCVVAGDGDEADVRIEVTAAEYPRDIAGFVAMAVRHGWARHAGFVPTHLREWAMPFPSYRPVDVTPPELRPDEGLEVSVAEGWAEPHTDPRRLPDLEKRRASALIPYGLDEEGRPRHPGGRTGKIGRNLGRWGENAAADPIVIAGHGPDRRVLLIRREDCGHWAFPGGHVEPGETAPAALVRELREETGVDLSGITPVILTRTLVADPRETDWAWIATTAALYPIPEQITPTAGDDATDAAWFAFADLDALTNALADRGGVLYEAHRPLLTLALTRLDTDTTA